MSEISNSTSLLIKSIEARCAEEERQLYKRHAEQQEDIIGDLQKASQLRHDEKIAKAKKEISQKTSAAQSEIFEKQKKAVSDIYKAAADEIFDEVKQKLCDFAKTDKYRAFLVKSASSIAESFGKGGVLYMRKCDMDFCNDICKVLDCTKTVTDDSIILGGIRVYYESKSLCADDTLDGRFSEACKSFIRQGRGLI